MSTKDFTANVISASKVVPDGNFKDSKASGIWDINEALDLIKGGNWPNAANVNPAAFVDALFQTHLYEGTGANQTITNNINLSGSGGLVWLKSRNGSTAAFYNMYDTERGTGANGGRLFGGSASTNAASTQADGLQSFNSDGFTLGANLFENGTNAGYGTKYVSWTFRQQPKFFDVVKYEGTGSARTVAHSLNTTVGMILIKNLDQTDNWAVYHRANTAAPQTDYLILNAASGTADSANWWNDTAPTTSVFTVGTDHSVNASGENYVAYLFAHNNDDGGFGEPGDQDIIKCGSYTGNGSSDGPTIDLGFEPQLVLIRKSSGSNWFMIDSTTSANTPGLAQEYTILDSNAAESTYSPAFVGFTSTGFKIGYTASNLNVNNEDDIYMAIRRGGMQTPTAASDVFSIVQNTNTLEDDTKVDFGIVPDMHIASRTTSDMAHWITARLTNGRYMFTNTDSVESSTLSSFKEEQTTVEYTGQAANDSGTYIHHGFKRARGFFDIVPYTGTGSAATVSHNLGVAPEMIWCKSRETVSSSNSWWVYHKNLPAPNDDAFTVNSIGDIATGNGNLLWNSTAPTSTVFSLGTYNGLNQSGKTYISFLWATLAGVSKVGNFSHTNGSSTDVDCGFSSGSSLVWVKRIDDGVNNDSLFYVWDSTRGIIAGNDPYFTLNGDANVTNTDYIDPLNSGFQMASGFITGDYIFYAIAAIS